MNIFFYTIVPLSYAERPDYLPDCIAIVEYWEGLSLRRGLGGIISAEGIAIVPHLDVVDCIDSVL